MINIPLPEKETKYCIRCSKVLKIDEYYRSNNLEKYPDGHLDMCKSCCTAHIDNWDPDTYMSLLEEIDVPWVPDEWNTLLKKYGKDPKKIKNSSIMGRYLAKMRLKQYKDQTFKDSDFVQQMREKLIRDAMKKEGYGEAEIVTAIAGSAVEAPPKPVAEDRQENTFTRDEDFDVDLTEEDIMYLKLKWGKEYQPFEWVQMEQLYQEFVESYDIQTAGHIDTLKAICKVSLRMNQLLNIGDVDGALKMTKAYDSLMKSGRFTAAQNKAENGDYVDSIGEIAAMCEKEGFIPRYYIESPNDKVDWVLKDQQEYIKNLVTEEMNLGDMLDKALKQIEEDKNREEDAEADEDGGFEAGLFADENKEVTDEDLIKFKEFEEELEKEDLKQMSKAYEKDRKKRVAREEVDQ